MVPVVIGHKGRQVNQFKMESGATIIIQHPENNSIRSVAITGSINQVTRAAMMVYDFMECSAGNIDNFENRKAVS